MPESRDLLFLIISVVGRHVFSTNQFLAWQQGHKKVRPKRFKDVLDLVEPLGFRIEDLGHRE